MDQPRRAWVERGSLSRRVSALRRLMRRAGVEATLLSNPLSIRHVTGFTGEDSCLLVGRRWMRLLTDGRFSEQARIECPHVETIVRKDKMIDAIAKALAGSGLRRLGIEGGHATVRFAARLGRAVPRVRTHVFDNQIDLLRQIKDAAELAAIGRAVRVAEKAFRTLLAGGARKFVGRTERQVAAELEYLMRAAGAEKASFDTIVAAGAHSSLPHHRPGDTKIRRGEAVLIDFGAIVDGYCSDLTRVVFVGRIRPQIARIYEVVLRSQAAGFAAVRPGVSCGSVDAAARALIAAAGYGEAFAHGLGHGLGLQVHELPHLGRRIRKTLRAGMVLTIEPGIYLPGIGGVRIEDNVVVVPGGFERLSRLSRRMDDMVLR